MWVRDGPGWLRQGIVVAVEAKFSGSGWKPGQKQRLLRFKNETTFSLIKSLWTFQYLNLFLLGHPVVRFASASRRKYLQLSEISNSVPFLLLASRSRAFTLTKNKYFDLNFWMKLSLLANVPYQQDNKILPSPLATRYMTRIYQQLYFSAFECQHLCVKTILVLSMIWYLH